MSPFISLHRHPHPLTPPRPPPLSPYPTPPADTSMHPATSKPHERLLTLCNSSGSRRKDQRLGRHSPSAVLQPPTQTTASKKLDMNLSSERTGQIRKPLPFEENEARPLWRVLEPAKALTHRPGGTPSLSSRVPYHATRPSLIRLIGAMTQPSAAGADGEHPM